jgi:hypothetical protein
MEFKHLNQPDFDRERDGALNKPMAELLKEGLVGYPLTVGKGMRYAYNEGYKQALRDSKSQRPPLDGSDYDELIAEVDKIDKET